MNRTDKVKVASDTSTQRKGKTIKDKKRTEESNKFERPKPKLKNTKPRTERKPKPPIKKPVTETKAHVKSQPKPKPQPKPKTKVNTKPKLQKTKRPNPKSKVNKNQNRSSGQDLNKVKPLAPTPDTGQTLSVKEPQSKAASKIDIKSADAAKLTNTLNLLTNKNKTSWGKKNLAKRASKIAPTLNDQSKSSNPFSELIDPNNVPNDAQEINVTVHQNPDNPGGNQSANPEAEAPIDVSDDEGRQSDVSKLLGDLINKNLHYILIYNYFI